MHEQEKYVFDGVQLKFNLPWLEGRFEGCHPGGSYQGMPQKTHLRVHLNARFNPSNRICISPFVRYAAWLRKGLSDLL